MSLTALIASALVGQAALIPAAEPVAAGPLSEVAYSELASGQSEAALRKLKASGAKQSVDPAVLINLGAAYAATGQSAKAINAYRAAIACRERYDLQLSDGTWMDSRLAARTALKRLMNTHAQAMR